MSGYHADELRLSEQVAQATDFFLKSSPILAAWLTYAPDVSSIAKASGFRGGDDLTRDPYPVAVYLSEKDLGRGKEQNLLVLRAAAFPDVKERGGTILMKVGYPAGVRVSVRVARQLIANGFNRSNLTRAASTTHNFSRLLPQGFDIATFLGTNSEVRLSITRYELK